MKLRKITSVNLKTTFIRVSKSLLLVILQIISFVSIAQNLIVNGDFENITSCPNYVGLPTIDQISKAQLWINPTAASPDLFHVCGTTASYTVNVGWAGVPNNIFGYQNAQSGSAYAGIVVMEFNGSAPIYREYIQTSISTPLYSGQQYYFEMYLNQPGGMKYSTDQIGVFFSNGQITSSSDGMLPYTPQINNSSGIVSDTTNWVLVSGIYTASGGEDYITIGSFSSVSNVSSTLTNSNGVFDNSYYYIDNVSLIPVMRITTTDTTICQNDSALISVSANYGLPPYSYSWSNGLPSTGGPHSVSPSITTDYIVTVTDSSGLSVTDTSTVKVTSLPSINFGNDTVVCKNNPILLDASTTGTSSYLWQDNSSNKDYLVTNPGVYWVVATSECGNSSDTVFIDVIKCDCSLYVPNTFTPNGDGLNDIFLPIHDCKFLEYEFMVFNRWGERIFETQHTEKGWDGKYNKLLVQDGVYVWRINIRDSDGTYNNYYGHVNIYK